MTESYGHIPVMLDEVVAAMSPQDGKTYIDGTFGKGGYSKALLDKANCNVIAIDRDPEAVAAAYDLQQKYTPRLTIVHGRFSTLDKIAEKMNVQKVDGVMLDIGISSMQIDNPERGFSFSKNGALDMRMEKDGLSAKDVINNFDENKLADIIYQYGEEKASRRIARAIAISRKIQPINTTLEFASIIRKAVGKSANDNIDSATKTFQAIRIYINDELNELEQALYASERILKKDGILAVVTFHSLEDRIVKDFIKQKSGKNQGFNRHLPTTPTSAKTTFSVKCRQPLTASKNEIALNKRSRSAKLRIAIRNEILCDGYEGEAI